jgi:CHAT domain-containing protein/Tfp pilus assembly protein PilF
MRLALLLISAASFCAAADLAEVRQLIDSGRRAEARALATRRLDSAPPGLEQADALNALAESWATGKAADTDRVRDLTAQALAIQPDSAESPVILANQLAQTGQFREAEDTLRPSIARHPDEYRLKLQLARFLMLGGDMSGSRALFESTLAEVEARNGVRSPETAEALTGFANLLNSGQKYAEARALLDRAVGIGEASPGRVLAESLSSLAFALYGLGDYRQTGDMAAKSIALFEADPSHSLVGVGPAYRIRGQSQEALGDYTGAKTSLERAVDADSRLYGEDAMQVADDQNVLGIVAANSGDMEAARKRFAAVLAIYEARLGAENPRTGGALGNLAQVLVKLRRFPEAKTCLERALRIQIRAGGPSSNAVAQLYQKLAQVEMGTSDFAGAVPLLERNLEIWSAQLGPSHPFTVNSLTLLADAQWHSGARDAALKTSLEAARLRREYVVANIRTGTEREALQIAGRNSRTIDTALAAATNNEPAARAAWDELIRSRALVLDEMAARYRHSTEAAAIGFDEVQAALPSDAALVAYVRFRSPKASAVEMNPPSAYEAFVLRGGPQGGVAHVISLGDAARIEAQVAAVTREIARERDAAGHSEKHNEEAYRSAGAALRRSVWDPVSASLAGAKQVYLVPDGGLLLINFGMLPVGSASYLVESATLFHVLSAERDLAHSGTPRSGAGGLLAVGNPTFARSAASACSPQFDPLPGSGKEAAQIASFWKSRGQPAETLTFAQATEPAFEKAVAGKQAIHIATHGFFLGEQCGGDNPLLRSGLAFAGGVLTAAQAASLNLENAEWVVLSGCDTGLGDIRNGEGVLGLRRAFQEAGARTVVASLWPVGDEETRPWMASLYRRRFIEGMSSARAIQATERETLRSRRAAGLSTHPYFWGSFIAVERE